MSNRTLFVTDAGSINVGGTFFMPGAEIPIEVFSGREASLRELVSDGKVSQRRRRMRTDESGRVIKIDRSAGAPPLPAELEVESRKRRKVRALSSKIVGGNEVAGALASLKRQQMDDEVQKAQEAKEISETAVALKGEDDAEQDATESISDADELAKIADEFAPEDDEIFDGGSDELFDEDAELLEDLPEE